VAPLGPILHIAEVGGIRQQQVERESAMQQTVGEIGSGNPFDGPRRRVLVTGGTGFIGTRLVNLLVSSGHAVTVVTRSPARAARLFNKKVRCVREFAEIGPDAFQDVVINLAGASIAGGRWSAAHKQKLYRSRLQTTQALVEWSAQLQQRPAVLINASAVGFYGDRPADEVLTESSSAGNEFMADLCKQWESAAHKIDGQGVRLVLLRFGVVFGRGGALPMMVLPFRLFVGGPMGSGQQMLSWIHIDDVMRVIASAITNQAMTGVYNAVAPHSVSQREFARTVANVLQRPAWITTPAWSLRLLAGEMADLFLSGQNVAPQKLLQEKFEFRYPDLESALENLL
jgi:uncharacterized protein (TIGR01777 family)